VWGSHGGRRMPKDIHNQNSRVEVYLELMACLIECDPLGITTSRDLRHDIQTLRSRYRDEGLSFLTKALPSLGKAFDLGLVSQRFSIPRGWKHQHGCGSRPAFMQAYFNLVFDECGNLRENVPPDAVCHLRQVAFAMYKLELPYSRQQEDIVIDSFVTTDSSLRDDGFDSETVGLTAAASYIARDVLGAFDPMDILPRHGPGAVATGEKLDAKWSFGRLYHAIHQKYPFCQYYTAGGAREVVQRLQDLSHLQHFGAGVAKVVLVPKDSRGPRLISCEPLEYQWIQQGLGRKLSAFLESHWLTSGQINFTDQSINQEHALSSSLTDEMSTLDLKDASDRVSLTLVRKVFEHLPDTLECLEATRTIATKLPDGRVIPLRKFAPMGSALCFPVEAFVFWTVIVAAIIRSYPRGHGLTTREILPLVGKRVFIYGDDIVVPREFAHVSMQALESVGLLVNRSKSCIQGPYRESCGMDAFRGVPVTPLRVKTIWTGQRTDGSAYVSWIALGNAMRSRGYEAAYLFIKGILERTYGLVPYGTHLASFPCWTVDDPADAEQINAKHFKSRYSSNYQRIEFFLRSVSPISKNSSLDGWQRLLRNFVSPQMTDPSTVVVPRSTKIKRGWKAVH
jgi:hypothetical protein